MTVTETTPPADPTPPAKGPFGKLPAEWRMLTVFVASAAFSILWGKFLPGVPAPQLPTTSPVVVYVGPGHEAAAK